MMSLHVPYAKYLILPRIHDVLVKPSVCYSILRVCYIQFIVNYGVQIILECLILVELTKEVDHDV